MDTTPDNDTPVPEPRLLDGAKPVSPLAIATWSRATGPEKRRMRQAALRGRKAPDRETARVVRELAAWHVRYWWVTPVAIVAGVTIGFLSLSALTDAPTRLGPAVLGAGIGAAIITPLRFRNARKALELNR